MFCPTITETHTTVQRVPGGGPYFQFSSKVDVIRSGVGKQIGLTHRLKMSGFSNRKSDKSFTISAKVNKCSFTEIKL